jgi:GntR family transcriptional regulator
VRYLEIAERLKAGIADGSLAPDGSLPSEADLVVNLGASRVTVRRALETLRADGLVTSRQGSGWFVAPDPVRQALGRVTTVEAALEAAGAVPERRVLEFAFEPAGAAIGATLGLDPAGEVLRVRRLNLADGRPFALVSVWVPGELGRYLSRAEVEIATFYDLLPLRGVALGRVVQVIGADVATADDARHLDIDAGDALLTATRTTFTSAGVPVLYSRHRYPAARTSMEIELPSLAFDRAERAVPEKEHIHG